MATFEIQAPNGQVLEVEGENPPNEKDLDQIFAQMDKTTHQPTIYAGIEYNGREGDKIPELPQNIQPEEIDNSSPVNFGQRTALAFSNDLGGQYDYLKKQFPDAEIYKKPNDTNFIIKQGDKYHEVNPKGLDFNDISTGLAILPEAVGGIGGAVAAGAATGGNPVAAVAGAGAGGGAGNIIKQNIAGLMGTQRKHDWKETGLSTALNAGGETLGLVVSNGGKAVVNSQPFKTAFTNTSSFLNSVPKKYLDRALEKELAGESILNGKFDAETAFKPVEKLFTKAKNRLPETHDINSRFYELGQKAINGLNNVKNKAESDIALALDKLPTKTINPKFVLNDLNNLVDSYAKGATINPAQLRASREISEVYNNIMDAATNPKAKGLTPMDLHNLKEYLYDVANYETTAGIKNNVAKNLANKLNQRLRNLSGDYAKANDAYALIKKIEYDAGGMNESTIGDKLFDYGNAKSIRKGFDKKIKMVDTLLPSQDKFLKDVKDFRMEVDKINNLKTILNDKYARNPKLLTHIKDDESLNALNELQRMTGVNFMDQAEDLTARGAMEKMLPGQGGGSGSSEGAGNLARTQLISKLLGLGGLGVATHNPFVATGALLFSPKVSGKGAVKSIGKLNGLFDKLIDYVPYTNTLAPAAASQSNKK